MEMFLVQTSVKKTGLNNIKTVFLKAKAVDKLQGVQ